MSLAKVLVSFAAHFVTLPWKELAVVKFSSKHNSGSTYAAARSFRNVMGKWGGADFFVVCFYSVFRECD